MEIKQLSGGWGVFSDMQLLHSAPSRPQCEAWVKGMTPENASLGEKGFYLRAECNELSAALAAEREKTARLLAALQSCVEWMEFTIPRLHTTPSGSIERLNWAGPISKAKDAIAYASR